MTFDDLLRTSIKLGMSLTEFYNSTPRDLFNFIKAKNEKAHEDFEQNWDYARHIMWASIAAMMGKDAPDVHKLIPLKRDEKSKPLTPYTKQTIEQLSKLMDKEMGL